MSTTTTCDNCGIDIRVAQHPFRLERHGDFRSLCEPDGWDFCSKKCLAAWVAPQDVAR
jgi:hypothetical protein